jgi:predicted Rossmann fold flavoprotein
MKRSDVIIAGAGPAGMMAAIAAAGLTDSVILVEKNTSPGKKLLLTGNGRCNFTNSRGEDTFFSMYGRNGRFLKDAFKNMSPMDLTGFFESRGLKCEADEEGRVFPSDNKASSVLALLESELASRGVDIIKGSPLMEISSGSGRVSGVKLGNGRMLACRALVIATGGVSYPSTGSTGEGLKIARSLGHTVTPLRPGLVPLKTGGAQIRALTGLSLSGVAIKVLSKPRKLLYKKGDLIFTHDGLSGPLILSASGDISDLIEKNEPVRVAIDLFPDIPEKEVVPMLSRAIERSPSRTARNCLTGVLPRRMADLFLTICGVNGDKPANQLTQKERSGIAALCGSFELPITGTYPIEKAMVTRGGVSLKEIDPRTMASKILSGLYFAGEIIDIDGETGGFNLQAAFSSGHLAGINASSLSY